MTGTMQEMVAMFTIMLKESQAATAQAVATAPATAAANAVAEREASLGAPQTAAGVSSTNLRIELIPLSGTKEDGMSWSILTTNMSNAAS